MRESTFEQSLQKYVNKSFERRHLLFRNVYSRPSQSQDFVCVNNLVFEACRVSLITTWTFFVLKLSSVWT